MEPSRLNLFFLPKDRKSRAFSRVICQVSFRPARVLKISHNTRLCRKPVSSAESDSSFDTLARSTRPVSGDRISDCNVSSTTGDCVGFVMSRLRQYGYMTCNTLKDGFSDLAIPSSVLSARALLIKYGGNSNRKRGTNLDSASSSLSNLSLGI